MLWLLIGAAIALIAYNIIRRFTHKACCKTGRHGYCFGHPGTGIISGVIGVAVFITLMGMWSSHVPDSEKWEVKTENLAVLNDGSAIEGSFFLVSGGIGEKPKFTFYAEENGVFRLKSVDADEAQVVYTDGAPVHEYHIPAGRFWTYWEMSNSYDVFKVPAGSIKYSYNLDAK